MISSFRTLSGIIFLLCTGINAVQSQSGGPEFPVCNPDPQALCITDPGVRLPANNIVFLGEENPDASSCGAHVTQDLKVRSTCGKELQYEVQLIIHDTSAAIILQPLTTITTDSVFEAQITFDSELSPDVFISQNGIPYTTGCLPYHRIKWIVTDSCGQTVICDSKVDLYDCANPIVTVIDYPTMLPTITGIIHLYVKDFIVDAKDDCTYQQDLLYSFHPEIYTPDTTFHICAVPQWGVEYPIDIWAADNGRDLNCDGVINWEEKSIIKEQIEIVIIDPGFIDCFFGFELSGNVQTFNERGIKDAHVSLQSPGHVFPTYITEDDGKYAFFLDFPPQITVKVEKNDSHKNGVSTLDLVAVQKHLLGIKPFTDPYTLIAADVNNSQNVSAIDLIEMRKLILGINTEFPENKSWRFIPANYVFPDLLDPWFMDTISTGSFDETLFFPNIQSDITDADFIGVKIGDINSTWSNATSIQTRDAIKDVNVFVRQQEYKANEIIEIDFSLPPQDEVIGFQFTIGSDDLEFLEASSKHIQLAKENFALYGDKLTMSWFDEDGFSFKDNATTFTLMAKAKRDGNLRESLRLNSDITAAEIYTYEEEVLFPQLAFRSSTPGLIFCHPNPWKETTTITFSLDKDEEVTLEIFDFSGRSVYSENRRYLTGENSIELNSVDVPAKGLLTYSIRSSEFVSTNKMMVIK